MRKRLGGGEEEERGKDFTLASPGSQPPNLFCVKVEDRGSIEPLREDIAWLTFDILQSTHPLRAYVCIHPLILTIELK